MLSVSLQNQYFNADEYSDLHIRGGNGNGNFATVITVTVTVDGNSTVTVK